MKIHCIRHEPFEGIGSIELWVQENNHHLSYTRTYLHQSFPDDIGFDMLIIMGGSASVYDGSKVPWLADEKNFIRKAINANKKILGICLGAQILADVYGAKVYRDISNEVGWFPIQFNTRELIDYPFVPEHITAFHWHGDTFDIPEGAIRIASSEHTRNQGFVIRNNIVALQFHLEMNLSSIRKIIKALGRKLDKNEKFVQSASAIFEQADHHIACHQLLCKILDNLIKNHSN
jgi:GMP synthase-like glutamine amidotransferase